MDQIPQEIAPQEEVAHSTSSSGKLRWFLGFLVLLLIGGAASVATVQKNSTPSSSPSNITSTPSQAQILTPFTLIYGVTTTTQTQINAYDIENKKTYVVATLPKNIKKVSLLSPTQLIFIGNTDDKDHGAEIATYDIKTKKQTTLLSAAKGYGIDDYVLSHNKKYLATWEVQFINQLSSGTSKVRSIEVANPNIVYTLYSEPAAAPVHYPRAITDNGEVYTDTFLANSGAGWAYGMSSVRFNGENESLIPSMQNGTYASQPILADNNFVFIGYDGSNGPGDQIINGFRRAMIKGNSVELFNTQTNVRKKLANIPSLTVYSWVKFASDSQHIIINGIQNNKIKTFSYSLLTSHATELSMQNNEYIAGLTDGYLVGTLTPITSTLSNLGYNYSKPIQEFSFLSNNNQLTPLAVEGENNQYIDVVSNTQITQALHNLAQLADSTTSLQLKSFTVNPAQQEQRREQQSDPEPTAIPVKPQTTVSPTQGATLPTPTNTPPLCSDLAYKQCNQPGSSGVIKDSDVQPGGTLYGTCVGNAYKQLEYSGTCYDSPLYLYGPEGTKIHITIGTQIESESTNNRNQFDAILHANNTITLNNTTVPSVAYSYLPAIAAAVPTKGTIVAKTQLSQTLGDFGKKLGLTDKETNDLIAYGKNHVFSPYVFVSFYDEQTSKKILPISFSPQVNTYINFVFYFKQLSSLPKTFPQQIQFPTIEKRGSITAVEISERLE